MANIKPYTDQIRGARYGREVRESIAAGIEAINDDVTDQATRAEAAADRAEAIAESIPADYTSLAAEVHANTQKNREQDGRISTNESDIAILRSAVDGNIITHESLTGEAYEVPLRSGTIGARVQSVGGKSYKSKNLADPTINISNSQGSCISNEDGTVTMSATSPIVFVDYSVKTILKANTDYFISGCPAGGLSPGGYFLRIRNADTQAAIGSIDVGNGFLYRPAEDTSVSLAYYWNASSSSGAVTFKPMIEEGSQKTDFEPYFEGIRNTAVEGFTNRGKNLFDKYSTSITKNVMLNNEGSTYSASGFNTTDFIEVNGQYLYLTKTMVVCTFDSNKVVKTRRYIDDVNTRIPLDGVKYVRITYSASTDGETMLNYIGYAPYTPYKSESRPLPSSVLSLPNYGHGLPNASNTLHFEERVYQNMKAVDLGSLTWEVISTNASGRYRLIARGVVQGVVVPASEKINGICTHYNVVSSNNTYTCVQGVCVDSGENIILYDNAHDTGSNVIVNGHASWLEGVILHYEATEGGEEYKAKVYEEKVGRYKFTGSEDWDLTIAEVGKYQTRINLGITSPAFAEVPNIICDKLKVASRASEEIGTICFSNTLIYTIINGPSDSSETVKNYFATNKPELVFELATPRVYDVTELLANFSPLFNTEGGGSITFDNEHQAPVPYNLYNTIKNSEAI